MSFFRLRVMSFNVRFDNKNDPSPWHARKHLVAQIIGQADLIGLQEPLIHQVNEVKEYLEDFDWVGVGRNEDGSGELSPIFYRKNRFEVIRSGTFWLSETPNVKGSVSWGSACKRICTWALFNDMESSRPEDSFVYMFNTHLDHMSEQARINGASLIMSQINTLSNEKGNFILTGDFNDSPSSKTLQQITLQNTNKIAQEKIGDNLGTFINWNNSSVGYTIDYIFVNDKVQVDKYETMSNIVENDIVASDHRPIVSDLTLYF